MLKVPDRETPPRFSQWKLASSTRPIHHNAMPTSFALALTVLALRLPLTWTDIHVDPAANCAVANGSAAAPFCTVTEALQVAVDGDRILVAAGTFPGPYDVTQDLTILGAGDEVGGTALTATASATILRVASGKSVTVERIRFSGGSAAGDRPGAIDNHGTLTLRNSTISNGGGFGIGASAIYQRNGSGALTLERCALTSNYVNSSSGALLRANFGGDVLLTDCRLQGNTQYHGPVIRGFATDFQIERTTFSGNTNYAAAVIQLSQCGIVMRNSTISSNHGAAFSSGAAGGTQRLEHCTIYRNAPGLILHGIDSLGPSPVQLANTIVAAGHPAPQTFMTLRGNFVSLGHNLVDSAAAGTGLTNGVLGDRVGSSAAPLSAGLGPLTQGPAFGLTHTPTVTSLALDAGSPAAPLAFDQHGFPRVPGGADIGAVERPLGGALAGCVAAPNSTGQVAELAASGAITATTNRLRLLVFSAPPGSLGMFLTSLTSASPGSTPPGSSGLLCLGGAIGRFSAPGQVQVVSAAGGMTLNVDLQALPQPTGQVAVTAGQTWYFQAWFRDLAGGQATSNLSSTQGILWS